MVGRDSERNVAENHRMYIYWTKNILVGCWCLYEIEIYIILCHIANVEKKPKFYFNNLKFFADIFISKLFSYFIILHCIQN